MNGDGIMGTISLGARGTRYTNLDQKCFGKDTRWCVVTGAPSSGKTTVLQQIYRKGFRFVPEVARTFIEEQLAIGKTLREIRADERIFQRRLFANKIEIEKNLPEDESLFLDRAIPDSITYYKVCGLDPANIFEQCRFRRYYAVFIFDRLPLLHDGARNESEEAAQFIDRQLELDYRALGHDVLRVPVMTVEKRIEFILEKLAPMWP